MDNRKRLRDLGIKIGKFKTGKLNSITDIRDVTVGHKTIMTNLPNGRSVRTGVTAILPHKGNLFKEKVIGSSYIINGFGKSTGTIQLEELGVLESPIMLTNTLSVSSVTEGTIRHLLNENDDIGHEAGTVNVVVGECNDGFLNDIRGLHVRPEHATEAILSANKDVEEGCIGAGTGMSCLGFKGGIGTSSRVTTVEGSDYTLGALVLTNFGKKEDILLPGSNKRIHNDKERKNLPDGSIMIVLATDAPFNERQLRRISKRAAFGLSRTGSSAAHGSGDIVLSFSTAHKIPHYSTGPTQSFSFLVEDGPIISDFFEMTVEAVEEAIWNSMCKATTMVGHNGNVSEQFPYHLLLN
ncbi:P1 family peptidase [Alkalihalobacillus sp. MEB130]|uniref:DmpA family aminopeptidase n=1 Tax=Alkalihalobacillus sp. MEB130 TaxID=2976704 RepID=UPI0028DDD4C8|nr:P1 family peptidase [Alkalihalobacillus sp. MEB130]MDT8860112.1 P1 family peptidase [Alkalihalobacillus sp. MEB130]